MKVLIQLFYMLLSETYAPTKGALLKIIPVIFVILRSYKRFCNTPVMLQEFCHFAALASPQRITFVAPCTILGFLGDRSQ